MDDEAHRHACEVRSVLAMGDKNRMKNYMDLCEKHRGKKAADRLRADVRAELIKLRESENGGGKKPGTRGATSSLEIHDQAGPSSTGEAGIQTGETGKAQGRKRADRGGNKSADKERHIQATLL